MDVWYWLLLNLVLSMQHIYKLIAMENSEMLLKPTNQLILYCCSVSEKLINLSWFNEGSITGWTSGCHVAEGGGVKRDLQEEWRVTESPLVQISSCPQPRALAHLTIALLLSPLFYCPAMVTWLAPHVSPHLSRPTPVRFQSLLYTSQTIQSLAMLCFFKKCLLT